MPTRTHRLLVVCHQTGPTEQTSWRAASELPARANGIFWVLRSGAPWRPPTMMIFCVHLRAVRAHRLAFWDAMLWASAHRSGVRHLLTEDLQDGFAWEGVTFNPFKRGTRSITTPFTC